jgi:hypothetical protein
MLSVGLVGLPNVGKSTLFNLLAGQRQAAAENFPFCTIEPNEAVVAVPDARLKELAALVKPEKVTPAAVKFVDIAGLVAGASKGEGLGNQFLAKIREVDAILFVTRFFENKNVIHVDGSVDPQRDFSTIETELILADLESLTKQREKFAKKAKGGDKEAILAEVAAAKILPFLEEGKPARAAFEKLSEEESRAARRFFLLTSKPRLFLANCDEAQLGAELKIAGQPALAVSAKFEEELLDLAEEERQEFLAAAGVEESGLARVVRAAFEKLGLISFFTAGEKEVRAWPVRAGAAFPEAAGKIHGDFEQKFIAAEVVALEDFLAGEGWKGARDAGKVRLAGKEDRVADGDVVIFKHG